jgi:hypothetical protein
VTWHDIRFETRCRKLGDFLDILGQLGGRWRNRYSAEIGSILV